MWGWRLAAGRHSSNAYSFSSSPPGAFRELWNRCLPRGSAPPPLWTRGIARVRHFLQQEEPQTALSSRAATLVTHTPTLPDLLGCTAGQAADTRDEGRAAWGPMWPKSTWRSPLPWERTAPARVSRPWPALPEVLAEGLPGRRRSRPRPRPLSQEPRDLQPFCRRGPCGDWTQAPVCKLGSHFTHSSIHPALPEHLLCAEHLSRAKVRRRSQTVWSITPNSSRVGAGHVQLFVHSVFLEDLLCADTWVGRCLGHRDEPAV